MKSIPCFMQEMDFFCLQFKDVGDVPAVLFDFDDGVIEVFFGFCLLPERVGAVVFFINDFECLHGCFPPLSFADVRQLDERDDFVRRFSNLIGASAGERDSRGFVVHVPVDGCDGVYIDVYLTVYDVG